MSDRDKRAYHHGDLRRAMVEAATREVEENGEASFSLRAVARTVGVSANAAYRHFDDRSALLSAVAAEGFRRMTERMLARRAGRGRRPPEVARFRAVGRAYVEYAIENPGVYRLMFGSAGLRELAREAGLFPEPSAWDVLCKCLDDMDRAGLIGTGARAGAELQAWSVVHGFASLVLEGATTFPSARARRSALDALLDFTVRALAVDVDEGASR